MPATFAISDVWRSYIRVTAIDPPSAVPQDSVNWGGVPSNKEL